MNKYALITILFSTFINSSLSQEPGVFPGLSTTQLYKDSRPWTRWWWFASEIREVDLLDNLTWLRNNGFGGVEIAWVYPLNRMVKDTLNYTPRQPWLSAEWSNKVAYAKKCADSLGLGCDFTFGSLWPFGDTQVPSGEAAMNMIDPSWRQEITASWDYPKKGYVIDHLDHNAFAHYAERTGNALLPALKGSVSGLFCDSWEVETKYLSTHRLPEMFRSRYGYSISTYRDSLYSNAEPYPSVRYDYMKLISELVIREFYQPFTRKCHELGAYSRAQCSGAPADILSAYAVIDVPESEALLYEPSYSTIVASSAALSGKNVVTSETFTCLYGWPRDHHREEQTADLKLLADALFANGVNHIIWHGKPLNPAGEDTVKFYASVHVGKSGAFAEEIPGFNAYLRKVSELMKQGRPASRIAVYLPTEDSWIAGELPLEKQFIWAWGEYEQRYTCLPQELQPWRPLWINGEFLEKALFKDGLLRAGNQAFHALYVDAEYLDLSVLKRIVELAGHGLPVCIKQDPKEPGLNKSGDEYNNLLVRLNKLENVGRSAAFLEKVPWLVKGAESCEYWCRETGDGLLFFFAHPDSRNITFPMEYGQSLCEKSVSLPITIHYKGKTQPFQLDFLPYQSVMIQVSGEGIITPVNIGFLPETPVFKPRIRQGKEKWEVIAPGK